MAIEKWTKEIFNGQIASNYIYNTETKSIEILIFQRNKSIYSDSLNLQLYKEHMLLHF